jgi:DnaJ family protein C protein 3
MPRKKDSESHYAVLGISQSASYSDSKKAYKKASLKAHPDKKGGSDERMKAVSS